MAPHAPEASRASGRAAGAIAMTTSELDQARTNPGGCGLAHFAKLDALPDETLKALERICRVRSFEPGQIVAEAGESLDYIGCVQSGILRMQKTLPDGRCHIVGLLVEGDMFGRVYDGPLTIAIEAATRAEVCAFRRAPFESLLAQSPELDRVMLLNVLGELDRAREWLIILSTPRVKARVAGFLLLMCARYAKVENVLRRGRGTVEVHVPIDRTDLAHLLGTRPESISRAFHALADDGSIALKRPDLVAIHDLDALAAEAGEEIPDDIPGLAEVMDILAHRPG